MKVLHLLFVVATALIVTCGGTANVQNKCVPGQSASCSGAAGCVGAQVCRSDGTYSGCDCGMIVDSGAEDAADSASDSEMDTGVDAGPFSVNTLPNLVLWLDTSKGLVVDPQNSGRIKRWVDQSGKGNDAVGGINCQAPCTPRLNPSALNGHDSLQMDQNAPLTITDNTTLQWGTGDWSIATVVKTGLGLSTNADVFWHKSDTAFYIQLLNYYDVKMFATGQNLTLTNPNPNKWQVLYARGNKLELGLGALTTKGQPAGDLSAAGSDVQVFGRYNLEVAEVVATKGALTDSDLASLTLYFKSKYSL